MSIDKVRYIQNSSQLLSHGDVPMRRVALNIIEHALAVNDSYPLAKNVISFDGKCLQIAGEKIYLTSTTKIFFVGAGKASFGIARAVEEELGDSLSGGLVICKYGQKGNLKNIKLLLASHPIPDVAGLNAAEEVMMLVQTIQPGDVLICGFTGGSSSLMPLPVDGITLADKQVITKILLACGANILEINSVRKHLSRIKGGQLALAAPMDVTIINLTVSDVIGNELDYITDPTVADSSTLADAYTTLEKYSLWNRLPIAVSKYFKDAHLAQETPKDLGSRRIHNVVLSDGRSLCTAAAEKARHYGYRTLVLSTAFEGESKEVGGIFAAIALEIIASGQPIQPPCAIIGGGETVVNLDAWHSEGGPNQEFSLSSAILIDGADKALIVGLDSDGTDGPTDYAGGMVDYLSASYALDHGLNLSQLLRAHKSSEALTGLDDVIITGSTGTNVNDLKFLLVGIP